MSKFILVHAIHDQVNFDDFSSLVINSDSILQVEETNMPINQTDFTREKAKLKSSQIGNNRSLIITTSPNTAFEVLESVEYIHELLCK